MQHPLAREERAGEGAGGEGLPTRLRALHRQEHGQMAIAMVLSLLVVFLFFALAFDAGLWFFDHRTAQNQSEAAALAGTQDLPQLDATMGATDTTAADASVNEWLTKNNADPCAPSCVTYTDRSGDGRYDTIRVEVERDSPGVFASLSGIDFVTISGAATATAGHASIANVLPWAIVPPDPDCDFGAASCDGDINGDGIITDGECDGSFEECPWGINIDNLLGFKVGGGGNTGIIDACGQGASSYNDCIAGETVSGFFEEGDEVTVGLQGGNLGQNTNSALEARYPDGDPSWADCDVESTPDADNHGYDPDGKADGLEKWWTDPVPGCEYRLVIIPILRFLPAQGGGSVTIEVLGVATFGIAKWNRESSSKSAWGTTSTACLNQQGGQPPDPPEFECGMVWGYLYKDVIPPDFLLQQISGDDNPLAPILIALID